MNFSRFWSGLQTITDASGPRKKPDRIGAHEAIIAIGILFIVSLLTSGYWLFLNAVPHTSHEDLARAVAMDLNFYDSFTDGQFVPRLQIVPEEYPDLPVFQYYGVMSGMLALPWLIMGIAGIKAIGISVILSRLAGLSALYVCARLLGGNRSVAIISSSLCAIAPYSISVLFGRSAVAEAMAQGFLPFLPLGCVLIYCERRRTGSVVLALAILCIALSHNIFLLYGCLTAGLLILLLPGLTARACGIGGLAAGVLLAAPQCYPAFLTRSDLRIGFTTSNPFEAAKMTLLGGFIGILRPLPAPDDTTHYFFTFAWWTLPILALLVVRGFSGSRTSWVILIPAALFTFAAWSPVDFWAHLPHIFWAVQFPYRLIAFSSMFVALGLAVAVPNLKPWAATALLVIALVSQWPVFRSIPRTAFLNLSPNQIKAGFADSDFLWEVPKSDRFANLWSGPWLSDTNSFSVPPGLSNHILRFAGTSGFPKRTIELWIARAADHSQRLTDSIPVPPGTFKAEFSIPPVEYPVSIVASDYIVPAQTDTMSTDTRRLSVTVSDDISFDYDYLVLPQNAVQRHGYSRNFDLSKMPTFGELLHGPRWIELPIAYSPFFNVTQGYTRLVTAPNARGLLVARSIDTIPIAATYEIPFLSWMLAGAGATILCVLLRWPRTFLGKAPATPRSWWRTASVGQSFESESGPGLVGSGSRPESELAQSSAKAESTARANCSIPDPLPGDAGPSGRKGMNRSTKKKGSDR